MGNKRIDKKRLVKSGEVELNETSWKKQWDKKTQGIENLRTSFVAVVEKWVNGF